MADLEALERRFKLMLEHIPRDGSTVDLQELFFRFTIDTATELLFGRCTDSLRMASQGSEGGEDSIFGRAFNLAQDDIVTRTRLGLLNRFRDNREGVEAIRRCHAYVDELVDDALLPRKEADKKRKAGSRNEGRYVFIQELAKQTTDKKRIRHELINVLLAGRDTTASLLSNMFFEVARRPDIYTKLRNETATLGGRKPTYEELRNLKYLKHCLNECKQCSSRTLCLVAH